MNNTNGTSVPQHYDILPAMSVATAVRQITENVNTGEKTLYDMSPAMETRGRELVYVTESVNGTNIREAMTCL